MPQASSRIPPSALSKPIGDMRLLDSRSNLAVPIVKVKSIFRKGWNAIPRWQLGILEDVLDLRSVASTELPFSFFAVGFVLSAASQAQVAQ